MFSSRNTGLSAFVLLLLKRLMSPPQKKIQNGDKRRIPPPESIARRLASRKFKRWKNIMGNDYPVLIRILPRLWMMGPTQRTCHVDILKQMSLSWNVDFSAKKLKHLRAIFANCFQYNRSPFALEFTSDDRRVLVVMFNPKNGEIFMTTELHDRFSGLIRKTGEHLVTLEKWEHEVLLRVKISTSRFGYFQFFYKWDVVMPFPYEMGCFWLDRYSRVLFWSDSRKKSFTDSPAFAPSAKKVKYVC